ncbi:hypothetical protein D3C85_1642520 [compost metagenome]
MQDKAAIGLDRATDVDRYVLAARGRFDIRSQLLKDIRQVEFLRAVDHQSHRAVGGVLDDVGQGLRKVRIGHVRHGDQELMLEIARADIFHVY